MFDEHSGYQPVEEPSRRRAPEYIPLAERQRREKAAEAKAARPELLPGKRAPEFVPQSEIRRQAAAEQKAAIESRPRTWAEVAADRKKQREELFNQRVALEKSLFLAGGESLETFARRLDQEKTAYDDAEEAARVDTKYVGPDKPFKDDAEWKLSLDARQKLLEN